MVKEYRTQAIWLVNLNTSCIGLNRFSEVAEEGVRNRGEEAVFSVVGREQMG